MVGDEVFLEGEVLQGGKSTGPLRVILDIGEEKKCRKNNLIIFVCIHIYIHIYIHMCASDNFNVNICTSKLGFSLELHVLH